jgi:putative two-component system response regulator
MMPELDGFETCKRLKASDKTKGIPVIFLTAKTDTEAVIRGFELGAIDYVTKPFNSAELLSRVNTHLELHLLRTKLEERVEQRTAELRQALQEITAAERRTYEAHQDTIQRLGVAAEYKDDETAAHIQRMSLYATLLADRLDLSPDEVELVRVASPMHDVGKIGIPESILLKPGKLNADEWETMRQHPILGAEILRGSPSELLKAGEVIARTHHEKWDGSGYPNGLAGADIPLWGRICALADVFDALTSKRPYKEAFSNEKALAIIKAERGKHFDSRLVDVFLENFDEVVVIQEASRAEENTD